GFSRDWSSDVCSSDLNSRQRAQLLAMECRTPRGATPVRTNCSQARRRAASRALVTVSHPRTIEPEPSAAARAVHQQRLQLLPAGDRRRATEVLADVGGQTSIRCRADNKQPLRRHPEHWYNAGSYPVRDLG